MKIGNKTYETVTVELLKELKACREGQVFLFAHGLEGFPLGRIQEIEGDYKGFVTWLKNAIVGKTQPKENQKVWEIGYRENGDVISMNTPSGCFASLEFDYYSDGQLKSYRGLTIPFFEKPSESA